MKYLSIVNMLLLLIICSCRKVSDFDWLQYESTAIINDSILWEANTAWFVEEEDEKLFVWLNHSINLSGHLAGREAIRIKDFPFQKGKHNLEYRRLGEKDGVPTAYFNTFAADGDVVSGSYELLEKEFFNNYIQIDSILADSSHIEGRYQLAFLISKPNPPNPDTLIITNGEFKAISTIYQ